MGGKKKKNFVIPNKPPVLTIEQMTEDVQNSDNNDYVFKFIRALDEAANEKASTQASGKQTIQLESSSDQSDSDDEFYEVRESFEQDATFKYETIEERYKRMHDLVSERDDFLLKKEETEKAVAIMQEKADILNSKLNDLRLRTDDHIKKHPTPEYPSIETISSDTK